MRSRNAAVGAACCALAVLFRCSAVGATDYATFHFDNARDGWNARETSLSQANAARITKVGDYRLDGEVDAQPLYLHREYIPRLRSQRSLAYVATENDTIYAVDPSSGVVWSRNYGQPVASGNGRCRATAPVVGIQGTPVIDRASDTLYFVSLTLRRGKPTFVLHGVSPGTGADKMAVEVAQLAGNAATHRQRVGLLAANRSIYVAFGGVCDLHPDSTFGQILAYDASTLTFKQRFVTTSSSRCPSFHLGTIWNLGFAPAADSKGNVYVATGNGCIDYSRNKGGGYADAVIRLSGDLEFASATRSLFAPCRAVRDNAHDQEMGSAGVLLAPASPFLVAGGKAGVTYVLKRDNLGGYRAHCPDGVAYETKTSWGIWGGPVAWTSGQKDFVAIAGTGPEGLRTYALDRRSGVLTAVSKTGIRLYNGGEFGVVTSDGAAKPASEVLWTLTRPTTGTIYLQAYDPVRLEHPLASVPAGSWGNPGGYADVSPTVADGLIFVATNKRLTIWGVRPHQKSR